MEKNRLESFSDGVFAFAITLLIINIKIPDTRNFTNRTLNLFLYSIIPHLLTFIFTFLVVGIFWVAHQRMFRFVKVIDIGLVWINTVYLLFIVIIPLPTGILASNPFLPTAILFYCSTLLIVASMHLIIIRYIFTDAELKHNSLTPEVYRSVRKIALFGPFCYIIAGISGFITVYISFFFIISVIIYYIFFARQTGVEKKLLRFAKHKKE